ncbi:MAG: DUF2829 domain-containing protein [Microbacterium sp.]
MSRGLSFGGALTHLRHGARVTRAGWNDKGVWLALWSPGTYHATSELFENAPTLRLHANEAASRSLDVAACIVMKAADGSVVFGWTPSLTDMLAEDWEVVS